MRSINAPWAISQDRPTTPEGILRSYLQKHPLYLPSQEILYRVLPSIKSEPNPNSQTSIDTRQHTFLNWQSGKQRVATGTRGCDPRYFIGYLNYFDAQISGKTFFLLGIEIESDNQGKGWGLMLYQLLEEIAQEFDCSEIQMTASGWTHRGETRADYLVRKLGYEIITPNSAIHEVRKEIK